MEINKIRKKPEAGHIQDFNAGLMVLSPQEAQSWV